MGDGALRKRARVPPSCPDLERCRRASVIRKPGSDRVSRAGLLGEAGDGGEWEGGPRRAAGGLVEQLVAGLVELDPPEELALVGGVGPRGRGVAAAEGRTVALGPLVGPP